MINPSFINNRKLSPKPLCITPCAPAASYIRRNNNKVLEFLFILDVLILPIYTDKKEII